VCEGGSGRGKERERGEGEGEIERERHTHTEREREREREREIYQAESPGSIRIPDREADSGHHVLSQLLAPPRNSVREAQEEKAKANTAGSNWFDLPATPITDEVKRDLRLLRLRGALDPKRHYKTWDRTKFPTHFRIGTVVEDAADFYSGAFPSPHTLLLYGAEGQKSGEEFPEQKDSVGCMGKQGSGGGYNWPAECGLVLI
jgi:hypothetical protein